MQLKKLQQVFAGHILHKEASNIFCSNDKFNANDLIAVYQNNYQNNFISALKASYSCVCRLVGENFFEYLAKQYLQKYPPIEGCLQNYGQKFSEFISSIEACNGLVYLSDIATLEFCYEQCYYNANTSRELSQLNLVEACQANPKLLLTVELINSDYPIISIWQLDENSASLDINQDSDCVLIYKHKNKITVIKISQKDYNLLTDLK